MPIVLLPKDGGATLLTMLSIYDNSHPFKTPPRNKTAPGRLESTPKGPCSVDTSPPAGFCGCRKWIRCAGHLPAAAMIPPGSTSAWQSMQAKITFPDDSKTDDLVTAGTEEVTPA